jgi:selenocysteine lyase/cysteine desulfurase
MATNRRNFLKHAAQLSALSILPFPALAKNTSKPTDLRSLDFSKADVLDEDFWKMIRLQFPLTTTKTYFNNGTMGPSPYPVIEAVSQKMMLVDSTGEYGGWEDSRKLLAKFVNADEDEISLTHNVTEGINIIAQGLNLKQGDEILITNHEHVGGALPWLNKAKMLDLPVNYFELGKTADETIANLQKKITKKTKVIAVPHIVCTIGQIQPIKEIVALAKKQNIEVFVDGAHGAGMLNLNLHELGCDYYATCCHKWLCGPKGTAFLYIKKEAQNKIQPLFVGAGSDNGWNIVEPPKPELKGYATTAHRYDYGTQNAALWAGVNAAIKFFDSITMKVVEARVKYLGKLLQQEIINLKSDNIQIITSTEDQSRGAVNAFKLKNMDYTAFQTEAGNSGYRVRVVPENGVNCIRISTHIYNSPDEINKFVKFVDEMARK